MKYAMYLKYGVCDTCKTWYTSYCVSFYLVEGACIETEELAVIHDVPCIVNCITWLMMMTGKYTLYHVS